MKSNRRLGFYIFVCNVALVLFTVFSFSGCANGMALAKKQDCANLAKPIGIFTLRTENAYKPSYQPDVNIVKFKSTASQQKATFKVGNPAREEKNQYFEYLVSVDLEPGEYLFTYVSGIGGAFPIRGSFEFPINASFSLTNGITYLGHVLMINRKRKEGETRSGPVVPLLDQSESGFAGGTFDITVSDQSETDLPDFIRAYPALRDLNITKAILKK
jgi:hypothetical protein